MCAKCRSWGAIPVSVTLETPNSMFNFLAALRASSLELGREFAALDEDAFSGIRHSRRAAPVISSYSLEQLSAICQVRGAC